jgi:hypothetical protein
VYRSDISLHVFIAMFIFWDRETRGGARMYMNVWMQHMLLCCNGFVNMWIVINHQYYGLLRWTFIYILAQLICFFFILLPVLPPRSHLPPLELILPRSHLPSLEIILPRSHLPPLKPILPRSHLPGNGRNTTIPYAWCPYNKYLTVFKSFTEESSRQLTQLRIL